MSQIYCFEKYSSKVFKFNYLLDLLRDERKDPDKDIKNIFSAYYYGSVFRIKATSTIEEETRTGVLSKRVKHISDDTIGYGLNNLHPGSVHAGWEMLAKIVKRNGLLRNNFFHEYIVGVLDCIETYSSYKRKCARCLTRRVKTSQGEVVQYYHRAVVLTLIGSNFPIPIAIELFRKGEDEVTCALRLLTRVVKNLGSRFFDIVIGDAMYCTPKFFSECQNLGLYAGAVLKDNQLNLLQTAQSQIKKLEPALCENTKKEKLKLWDIKEVCWDTADQEVRVIWAERKVWEKDEESPGERYRWVSKKNVFAFSKKIDHLPASVVYNIGRHRWDIDARLFMDAVKHWHLKHKTLHFERSYENMLNIRLIAYMIFMFFFYRHINSRRKEKIKTYKQMSRILYRSAITHLEPDTILVE